MTEKITLEKLKAVIDTIHNLREVEPDLIVDMTGADLSGLDMTGLDLSIASLREANLSYSILDKSKLNGVDLQQAILTETSLKEADLTGSNLYRANLFGANLFRATLKKCNLSFAQITGANLAFTDMCDADCKASQLTVVNMNSAICRRMNLLFTVFNGVEINECDFEESRFNLTVLAGIDLSNVKGLDKVIHESPSYIDSETLRLSKGKIPQSFLLGCDFRRWEIIGTKLYETDLSPLQIRKICDELLDERLKGENMRRVFISYSHADENFVKKLYRRLQTEGVIVWLDKHELNAGSLQRQIKRALEQQDVVIVVLSQHSIKSDWVENELDLARKKEKDEKRDVLCPIAIDDSWKEMLIDDEHPSYTLWRKLSEKYILDFTKQNRKSFEDSFAKLMRGVKINYNPELKKP